MEQLLKEMGEWAGKTFPNEGVEGKLEHLKEEIDELLEDTTDVMEWADCFNLLYGAAIKAGIPHDDIAILMRTKFEENKKRTWVEDKPGRYHHVKE